MKYHWLKNRINETDDLNVR